MTHLSDIEVNVMGHRFYLYIIDLVAKHKSGELCCPATALATALINCAGEMWVSLIPERFSVAKCGAKSRVLT